MPQCTLPCRCSSILKDQEPWQDFDWRRLEIVSKAFNPSHHILKTHCTNCSLTGEYFCSSHPSNAIFNRPNILKRCLLSIQSLIVLPLHREGKHHGQKYILLPRTQTVHSLLCTWTRQSREHATQLCRTRQQPFAAEILHTNKMEVTDSNVQSSIQTQAAAKRCLSQFRFASWRPQGS